MRSITKSQVTDAIRFAKSAHDDGRDPVAALNSQFPALGLAGSLTTAQANTLRTAYLHRGERGAVEEAVHFLRTAGIEVTEDVAAEVEAILHGDAAWAEEAVNEDNSLEDVAQVLSDRLFEGGQAAARAYIREVAEADGIKFTDAQAVEFLTKFSTALREGGIHEARAALEAAYEAAKAPQVTPTVEATDTSLEDRVARLEQIARANGLL